jgi:hypothetical protein
LLEPESADWDAALISIGPEEPDEPVSFGETYGLKIRCKISVKKSNKVKKLVKREYQSKKQQPQEKNSCWRHFK